MNPKRVILGAAILVILCLGFGWYRWDRRPIDVLNIDPEQVLEIHVSNGWDYGVFIRDREDIRQLSGLLNQMTVRKTGYGWDPSGYKVTVYRVSGPVNGTSWLGDWAWNGWNMFYWNGSQVWYDGSYYQIDEGLAEQLQDLIWVLERQDREARSQRA